jgi:hypothetical protein
MTTAAAFVAYPYTNRGGYGCVRHASTQAHIMTTQSFRRRQKNEKFK